MTGEVAGRSEDVQELLFGPDLAERPVLSDPAVPAHTRAAATAATETVRVTGGPGSVRVSCQAIEALQELVDRHAERVGAVLLQLLGAGAELAAWALIGRHALAAAGAAAARAGLALAACEGALGLTSAGLLVTRQRYEAVEDSVAGLFGPATSAVPLRLLPAPLVREAGRTLDELGVALARAEVRSPRELSRKVRVTAFGLVVADGGPEGTDAVIRGPGLDDVLDPLLAAPLPTALGRGPGTPRPPDGATAREYTLGEYARERVTRTLRRYGDPSADLTPLERLLYPLAGPRALRPVTGETFSGITPGNAERFHLSPARERPLPRGVTFDGAAPVTVAGTAAALKDAKNIVRGRDGHGREVENSTVMVQKATDASGRSGYSVVLTGTERWVDGPGVHDLRGIADAMAATPGDGLAQLPAAQRMVLEALEDAGARPGDPVVLTGHSLGGIDAAGLAANREFRRRYSVAAVTTFGAPVGGFPIPRGTSVLSVEHVDDVVPPLDGRVNPDSATRATVRVNTPYGGRDGAGGRLSGVDAHDMYVYTLGAQGIGASGHPAVVRHEHRLAAAIPHGPRARTETYVYHAREEHGTSSGGTRRGS